MGTWSQDEKFKPHPGWIVIQSQVVTKWKVKWFLFRGREWERVEIEFGVKVSSSKVVAWREGVSLIKRPEGFHIQILTDGCDGLEGRGSNGARSLNEWKAAGFVHHGRVKHSSGFNGGWNANSSMSELSVPPWFSFHRPMVLALWLLGMNQVACNNSSSSPNSCVMVNAPDALWPHA